MATIQDSNWMEKLKSYIDSPIEKVLISILQKTLGNVTKLAVNLEIENTNACRGCSFADAYVELEPYSSAVDVGVDGIFYGSNVSNLELVTLEFDQLFNVTVLREFIISGVKSVMEHPEKAEVFLSVMDFLRDLDIHQTAIDEIKKKRLDVTSVTVVLAQHLFSQLVPDKQYIVNDRAKQLSSKCVCPCQSKINTGNTALGSMATWHGFGDILVNHTVTVAVHQESAELEAVEEEEEESYLNNNENQEPIAKRFCAELANEVKNSNKRKNILMQEHTFDQVVAQAITNAFCHINMNNNLSGWAIPTVGCTSDHMYIFLYDPVNDILLHTPVPFEFWIPNSGNLKGQSFVLLWLFLNFTTFMVRDLSSKFELKRSKFHQSVEKKIEKYQMITTKMEFDVCTATSYEHLVPMLFVKSSRVAQNK